MNLPTFNQEYAQKAFELIATAIRVSVKQTADGSKWYSDWIDEDGDYFFLGYVENPLKKDYSITRPTPDQVELPDELSTNCNTGIQLMETKHAVNEIIRYLKQKENK